MTQLLTNEQMRQPPNLLLRSGMPALVRPSLCGRKGQVRRNVFRCTTYISQRRLTLTTDESRVSTQLHSRIS